MNKKEIAKLIVDFRYKRLRQSREFPLSPTFEKNANTELTTIIDQLINSKIDDCAKIAENLMSKDKMYYNKHIQDKIAKAIRDKIK